MKNQPLLLLLSCLLFYTCANQGYPPGGPVDKRGPFVVNTLPTSDSTLVPLDSKIEITFNEHVNHQSCEEAIFITPFPGKDIKYKWKGKTLRINIPGNLLENRTYVVTIGTGTRDNRNNPMEESYTLAFATGSQLDKGAIAGIIFSKGRSDGTQIWAFDLEDTPEPNPSITAPIYITQVNKDGSYKLPYMSFSTYRVFAVNDRDVNGLYDPEYDALGVTSRDVRLDEAQPFAKGLNFRISVRDTTQPNIESISVVDAHHFDLRFSEPMSSDFLSTIQNYTVTNQTDSLEILEVFQDERNAAYVHFTTTKQDSGEKYQLTINNAYDLAGFPIKADSNKIPFDGSVIPDTTKPKYIYMIPADSSNTISIDTAVELYFSEPLNRQSLEQHFKLADTLDNVMKGRFEWINGARVSFQPTDSLKGKMNYFVTLPVDSVFDQFNNALADTLFKKTFSTMNPDTLSEISGQIMDMDSTASGLFHIKATSTEGIEYETWVDNKNLFQFKNLLPGIYILEIYQDKDKNGKYSFGEAFPYVPAERIYSYPDSVNVRSKWPNEGNDIFFP